MSAPPRPTLHPFPSTEWVTAYGDVINADVIIITGSNATDPCVHSVDAAR